METLSQNKISPTYEEAYDTIMCLKNNFLRGMFLSILGSGDDQEKIEHSYALASYYLMRQKKEADEFWEKIKRSEVTVGEFLEFREHRINALYCPVCIEEVKEDSKYFKCVECQNVFHEDCSKKVNNGVVRCIACINESK